MSKQSLAQLQSTLADLDLADPSDFLVALCLVETWPGPGQLTEARFHHDFPIIEEYHSQIFDLTGRGPAVEATWGLLRDLAHLRVIRGGREFHYAPREWLAVFRGAFAQGLINRIVFGAAASFLLSVGEGNGSPAEAPGSAAAIQTMLNDVRSSSPLGLMNRRERQQLGSLPPVVTVYRGGSCTDGTAAGRIQAASEGLYWALEPTYSRRFMTARAGMRTLDGIRHAAFNSLPLLLGGVGKLQMGFMPAEEKVEYFLVRGEIPRRLVLAYWERGYLGTHDSGDAVELIVDVDQLTPDMLQDVTPDRYRRVAA